MGRREILLDSVHKLVDLGIADNEIKANLKDVGITDQEAQAIIDEVRGKSIGERKKNQEALQARHAETEAPAADAPVKETPAPEEKPRAPSEFKTGAKPEERLKTYATVLEKKEDQKQ